MAGQVVIGDKYFVRKKDEKKLWRYIRRGDHLILLAPRRAGKTSLLRQLEKNPADGYVFLYTMVQSCTCEAEFYRSILQYINGSDFIGNFEKATRKGKDWLTSVFDKLEKINVADTGITLKDNKQPLTFTDIAKVIKSLEIEQKLVIVVDEYPDVVERIKETKGIEATEQFLKNTRSLCQDTELSAIAQFIFTGSIGLHSLASKLKFSNLINDQDSFYLPPLHESDAKDFIHFLNQRNNSNIALTESIIEHILTKVTWLIPYYIEILWERLEDHCEDQDNYTPTITDIDAAYEQLFHQAYRKNFNHWVERLKRFKAEEQAFAKAILSLMAKKGQLDTQELFNLNQAEQYQGVHHAYVVDCLEHDGYLFESERNTYRFTSPILQDWWDRYAERTL